MLSWVALAPLIFAVLRARESDATELLASEAASYLAPATVKQGFLLGYASGVVWYMGNCYWVYHVMHSYGGLHPVLALLLLILFSLYLGLYHGIFAALVAWAAESKTGFSRRALVLAPFLWVSVELARSYITGFPWDLLGTAQVDNVPLARLASVTGVYGLSFEIALVNAAFAAAFLVPRRKRNSMLAAALIAAVALQSGRWMWPEKFSTTASASLVQQNIPIQQEAWTLPYYEQTLRELGELSASTPKEKVTVPGHTNDAGLIVWPESPAPFFLNDQRFAATVSGIARANNSYVVAGSLGVRMETAENNKGQLYNSAVLIAPDGRVASRYDKVHLVPFGEYVPFKQVLAFAKSLTSEVGNFSAGAQRVPLEIGDKKVGVFICYESVFPGEIRQFAANGAQVFVNISNDGWFGNTGAPLQHLNMARMRAIENERWLLRDTNTGITAVIDPYGRIVQQAARNERVVLQAQYDTVSETTLYTRYGDWFPILCAIISLFGLLFRWRTSASMAEPQPV